MSLSYGELFRALLPETALVLGALAVLTFDLTLGRSKPLPERQRFSVLLGLATVIIALYGTAVAGARGSIFGGVLELDLLAVVVRLGSLALLGLALGLLQDTARLRHPAEFVAVLLFATTGFSLMASAGNLLIAFLAIELASLSLYVLAGFDKDRPESAEAALKYFLFGGMSAAFLLFGFSLIYGLTGAIDLGMIATQLGLQGRSPLLMVALVMVTVAFGFKVAAAPFHLWAPDVYQGAPPASAGLIASASKLAGIAVFTRLLWPGLGSGAGTALGWPVSPGWMPALALVAAASLVVGNLGALAQGNVRRLLAYSAIAHAGSLLLGVITAGSAGPGPVLYYAATYGLATVGAFGVVAVLAHSRRCDNLTDLAGLHRRSPLLAACLAVFVFSLAGIPPLAGFFGKFAVYAAALRMGGVAGPVGWLTLAAIGFSAVSLYYYLLILKQALVAKPAPDAPAVSVPASATLALLATALLLLVLGLFPSTVLRIFG